MRAFTARGVGKLHVKMALHARFRQSETVALDARTIDVAGSATGGGAIRFQADKPCPRVMPSGGRLTCGTRAVILWV